GNGTTAHGRGPRASSASAGRAATGRRLAALVGTARRRSRVMARLRRAAPPRRRERSSPKVTAPSSCSASMDQRPFDPRHPPLGDEPTEQRARGRQIAPRAAVLR
ncbi:MAG TPA: hypothetical protein VFE42_12360, partial [Chloroflexota bacterium]|nr:hypothetical protein [Chloroflexota bacterium]